MELRVLIVLVACLSCLVPPALGLGLVKKAMAIGAVKGAVIGGLKGGMIGAKVGLAAKGVGLLLAKKVILGVLLKAAAIKGAGLLAGKKGAVAGNLGNIMAATGLSSLAAEKSASEEKTSVPGSPLTDILSGSTRAVQSAYEITRAAGQKSRAVYRVMSAVPRLIAPVFN